MSDENLISDCGCRFESDKRNAVILCDECSELPCHHLRRPREQALINAVKAFENPLEAVGIVMRATGAKIHSNGPLMMTTSCGKSFNRAPGYSTYGQDILNTLKEGK